MKKLLLAAAAAAFSLAAAPTFAQVGTGQQAGSCDATGCSDADLDVVAVITGQCISLEVGDLDFLSASQGDLERTAETAVEAQCVLDYAYEIQLDYGFNNNTSDPTVRQVAGNDSSVLIDYQLYQDAARTVLWGETADGTGFAATGTGNVESYPIYGTLNQVAANPPDTYTDLVTASIVYAP